MCTSKGVRLLLLALGMLTYVVASSHAAVCDTRPKLQLYSGYASRGLTHLQASVKELQALLNQKGGSSLAVDGLFGQSTVDATKQWQSSHAPPADGIVGPITWASLCGSAAPAVPASPVETPTTPAGVCSGLLNPHKGSVSSLGWTARMKFVVDKIAECYGDTVYCDPLSATRPWDRKSDHSRGNAIDCYPGSNRSGSKAVGKDKEIGDAITDWLVAHADELQVYYVVWYRHIWSNTKASKGWRDCAAATEGCNGSGHVIKSHFDHFHVSVRE